MSISTPRPGRCGTANAPSRRSFAGIASSFISGILYCHLGLSFAYNLVPRPEADGLTSRLLIDEPTVVSPCAERSAVFLTGLPGATFTKRLGQLDWCRKSARSDLILWTDQDCVLSPVWGYSFYRIPALGDGPELEITFDQMQTSTALSWVHSQ